MAAQLRFSPSAEQIAFSPDPGAHLPATAEVVVVGAGMVGASVAYRLALAGMRPLVIEANAPASGASGRLAGMALSGLGGHFARVTRLVQAAGARSIADYTTLSLGLLEALDAELPGGVAWDRVGSLDLFTTEAQDADGRQMAALQAAEGIDARVIDSDELRELAPEVGPGAVLSAKWTPGDGQLHPIRLVYALLDGARAHGATIVTGVRVEQLLARAGRASGVATSHGAVACGAVLLATNAWSPALVPHIGANLTPIREHVCVTEPIPPLLTRSFETNLCNEYWRQLRTGEVLIGGFSQADEGMGVGSYSQAVHPSIPPLLGELLGKIHPAARDARVVRCWAGLLDFASLEIPMMGRLPAEDGSPVPGAYLACGLTGHGLPYAPVMGLLLAELISGGEARTLSLAPFDPAQYVGARHEPTWIDSFNGRHSAA